MRIFVAIDLTDDVRAELAGVQEELRPVTDTARWVSPSSIHLTLKFIGETAEQRIEEIDSALRNLNWKPFLVTVRGVGFFPGARSPRVFWAGMEAPSMPDLAIEIDTRLERLGLEREKRKFRPHITLARARENRMDTSLVNAAQKFEGHEFGSFTVERFFLYQSTLKPSGAVYTQLRDYPLERR
jgi:RNA 2',3'-cyclic 3'-phosphodiesterase